MGIAMGKKKEKKEREPQYRQSLTNMQVRNYRVYEMSPIERILVFLAAFAAGAFCGYLFYGGLAKDPYGNATLLTYMLNLTIPSVVGIAAGFFFLPIWEKRQQESRQSNLKKQFLDLLESLSTSLLAGKIIFPWKAFSWISESAAAWTISKASPMSLIPATGRVEISKRLSATPA